MERALILVLLVLLAGAGRGVLASLQSSSQVLCLGQDKATLCPTSAGCCSDGCCDNPGSWKLSDHSNFHSTTMWLPVVAGLIICACMFAFCIGAIIRACLCRQRDAEEPQSLPPPGLFPTTMSPYSPAFAPTPFPATQPALWGPPPPYHTVVANPPPCLPTASPC